MHQIAPSRRVAVVAGCRSPFCKAGTLFKDTTALDLARHTVVELLHRAELRGREVDEVYFGQVVSTPLVPNLAREVSLLPQLPPSVPAAAVNRACASANAAITLAYDQIVLGHADVVIAGGAESLSNVPILHSRGFSEVLVGLSKAHGIAERARLLAQLRPRDLVPVTPAIAEPSTGETMGEAAERMAKINGITRASQDEFALRSHRLASAGAADGRLTGEVAPYFLPDGSVVERDNGVRSDTSLERMATLRPAFDRRHGTVTAANSSPLTDGACGLVLMSEDAARRLGHEAVAFIRSYAVAAVDPTDQLLMGPPYAVARALERAGIPWGELGLVEMHEAFAAQVLSNIQAFESRSWASQHLGRDQAVAGTVDWSTLNVMGGSIAIGHPFGATGGRLTLTLANEMRRRDVQFGLVSVCAQGGMGFAMVLERR